MARPDAESVAIELIAHLAPASTGNQAGDHLRVQRKGGSRDLVSDLATLVIDAYSIREERASELLDRALDVLLLACGVDGVLIYSVEILTGPANDPDPDTEQVRYSATVQMRLRGVRR